MFVPRLHLPFTAVHKEKVVFSPQEVYFVKQLSTQAVPGTTLVMNIDHTVTIAGFAEQRMLVDH
ncbi:hypothetical protein R3I94_019428 [Phoxinus phoxinus]